MEPTRIDVEAKVLGHKGLIDARRGTVGRGHLS
jgi:hypothetical protein